MKKKVLIISMVVLISMINLGSIFTSIGRAGDANAVPHAVAGGPYSGAAGQPVTLDGSGSYDLGGWIVLYKWDIDGDDDWDITTSSSTTQYTYSEADTYIIKLQVKDNEGAWSNIATTYATIGNPLPLIANAGGPYYGNVDEPVCFTGSATGGVPPYTFEWDFEFCGTFYVDDTGQNVCHTYREIDTYTVALRVTDSDDETDFDTTTATISEIEYNLRITITTGKPRYDVGENIAFDITISSDDVSGYDCTDYDYTVIVEEVFGPFETELDSDPDYICPGNSQNKDADVDNLQGSTFGKWYRATAALEDIPNDTNPGDNDASVKFWVFS